MKRLLPLLLLLSTLPAFAAKVSADITDEAEFFGIRSDGRVVNVDNINLLLDDNLSTGISINAKGFSVIADFTFHATADKPTFYMDEITIGHSDFREYSLYVSADAVHDSASNANATWIPLATNVTTTGETVYLVRNRYVAVKYVVEKSENSNTLCEFHVTGFASSQPTKMSDLARSHFIRNNRVYVGNAGTNGGHYSNRFFNGDFADYTYCNRGGTTELVIPTTWLNPSTGIDTDIPWYVTEFKVGHRGNSQYSLYYTTNDSPNYALYETAVENDGKSTYYVGLTSDDRNWIPIDGATGIQEQGTNTFLVNKTATAVKYVFDTDVNWQTSLAEVEVWAIDPDDLLCTHPNLDLATAAWAACAPATCTENAKEECFCPDCGERLERDVPLTKLGHIYVATLTRVGRPDRYGSGFVSCSRTLENPFTHESWSCDFRIDFDGRDVDFTTLGGIPINGVVQYTDLTAYSTGGQDGGITPEDVKDNVWAPSWNGFWFANGLSTNEYVQYQFGTTIELTKIEFSVINDFQTVYFTKYDPETGEETLLRTIPIVKDETEGALEYQRQTVDFFVYDKNKKTFVDAIRMHVGDYIDPETGEMITDPETGEPIKYKGTHYGIYDYTCIIEFHPWGTIQYAGLMTHPPTTVMLIR